MIPMPSWLFLGEKDKISFDNDVKKLGDILCKFFKH